MTNKNKVAHKLPIFLTPAFLTLGFVAILLILGYFHLILVPKLYEQNQSHAQIFAKSLSHELMHKYTLEDSFFTSREVSKILLYNDPTYNESFILGLNLELNPDVFPGAKKIIKYGFEDCDNCFTAKILLTDIESSEILGTVKYWINPKGHNVFLEEITGKFYLSIFVASIILLLIWITMQRLYKKMLENQNAIIAATKHSQLILDSMLDIVLLINEDGKIIDSNPAAQTNLKFKASDLKHIYIYSLIEPSYSISNILKMIKNLNKQGIEISFFPLNSNPRYGILHASKFITENQETRFLLVIKDTHDLRLAQNKLQFQAEVAHSSRLKSLGELASGIAHEINQPLAIIRLGIEGIKEIIQENNPKAMEISIAQDVLDQVDRASNIINNMRSFARYESTPKDWIDPLIPVRTSINFLKEQLRVHGIKLTSCLPISSPKILFEQQKAEQILINLIINARHALDEITDEREKEIKITLETTPEKVILKVRDNGEGMSQETLERCLDPFFTTKATGEGTGLGLAIVKSIADEFDIEIDIKSELGKSTTFILSTHHENSRRN